LYEILFHFDITFQLPTATNAHGATNSTQYAKPATYNSGYGSGYDSLSGQGTADYTKNSGGYVSAGSQGGQSSKANVVGNAASSSNAAPSASDLTSSMYSKTHVALNKVNVSKFIAMPIMEIYVPFLFHFLMNNIL
jgi:hypothetical protein